METSKSLTERRLKRIISRVLTANSQDTTGRGCIPLKEESSTRITEIETRELSKTPQCPPELSARGQELATGNPFDGTSSLK
jgi:hypothetical protein